MIAHGGAGKINHIIDSITYSNADAVALASMLHYAALRASNKINSYEDEGNIEFLKEKNSFKMFGAYSLEEIKVKLHSEKISLRLS